MKKVFLGLFFLTVMISNAKVWHFISSCGVRANVTISDNATPAQVHQAFVMFNYNNCGESPGRVRMTISS